MSGSVELDAYLDRVGWRGDVRPDYETLAGLLDAHMARIPFENLDVLLGRPVRLDLESLSSKLVAERRGGYCFEHASLFAAVLQRVGFAVVRHTARVVLYVPRHLAPRTHMFLTVTLPAGRFIVDPGFGGLAARVPVPWPAMAPPSDGMQHWVARDGEQWVLRTRVADQVKDCWVSTMETDHSIDFEVANHYTSTHPASPFRNRLMLRALTPTGHVAVMNRDVTETRGEQSHTRVLRDRASLRALVCEHFGFDLPAIDAMRVPSIPEWR